MQHPTDDTGNDIEKENLVGTESSSGKKFCLNKMEKLVVPATVDLLQSINFG